jgi:hypothetical protein
MASHEDSIRPLRRKLRAAQKAARLLDQELKALADGIPCPSEEQLAAILSHKPPLTLELLLMGLVNLGQFHASEAGENLTLALMATNGRLDPKLPIWWLRDDFRNSLANVLAVRTTKGKSPRQWEA